MFDPFASTQRPNRYLIYFGACIIAGIRQARETHVKHRQMPTSAAIDETMELAHEIFGRVFSKVPEKVEGERSHT